MCGGGGGKGANRAAEEAAAREAKRQARISRGSQSIDSALAPFNDDFWAGRQKAYTDYASPYLNDQFADAKKNLIYALSRSGLLSSSIAGDRQRKLNEEYGKYKADVVNQGKSYVQKGRQDLESTRSNLLSQLTATENPESAATAAQSQALLLQQDPSFDPIGQFLFTAADGLEDNANRATGYRGYASGPSSFINSGSSRSVRYNN